MAVVGIEVLGDKAVVHALTKLASTAPAKARAATVHWGALYQTRVKAAASGRPGPRAITGDYRRSISIVTSPLGTTPMTVVFTNKPQARRLELGFVGEDSLGRHYAQPPFPHWEPPLAEIAAGFRAAVSATAVL